MFFPNFEVEEFESLDDEPECGFARLVEFWCVFVDGMLKVKVSNVVEWQSLEIVCVQES